MRIDRIVGESNVVEHMLTLFIVLHFAMSASKIYKYNGTLIMNDWIFKNKEVNMTCQHSIPYPVHINFHARNVDLGNTTGKQNKVATESDIKFLSETQLQINSADCTHTTVFRCIWTITIGEEKGTEVRDYKYVKVIDYSHNVTLKIKNTMCRKYLRKCEECNLPGVDAVEFYGVSFTLSCSTVMPYPIGKGLPNQYRWYIDRFDNGTYSEILSDFTNPYPLRYDVQTTEPEHCTPMGNEVSLLTYKHEWQDSTLINIKCQTVLKFDEVNETKDKQIRICMCKNDTIFSTVKKEKCNSSDINCKNCSRPGVDAAKRFGESFNVSCFTLMPFSSSPSHRRRFRWLIDHLNTGEYIETLENVTTSVSSYDNLTDTNQHQCVILVNETSVFTYTPKVWKSKQITIKCQKVANDENNTVIHERLVRICFYEKWSENIWVTPIHVYSLWPLAIIMIFLLVCATIVFIKRKKQQKLRLELTQQSSVQTTESETKVNADCIKTQPGDNELEFDNSKETDNISDIDELEFSKSEKDASDYVSDQTTPKTDKKQKKKTSKHKSRSTKEPESKLENDDEKSVSQSEKVEETGKDKPSSSVHAKSTKTSQPSSKTSKNVNDPHALYVRRSEQYWHDSN